jgi:hypothetical protein
LFCIDPYEEDDIDKLEETSQSNPDSDSRTDSGSTSGSKVAYQINRCKVLLSHFSVLLGSALAAAANGGYERIVGLLLDHGVDVNLPGGLLNVHALLGAASEGHEGIVELLLDRGADVNLREGYRDGALAAATYKGHKRIVKLLLDRGADINRQGPGRYGNALVTAAYAAQPA